MLATTENMRCGLWTFLRYPLEDAAKVRVYLRSARGLYFWKICFAHVYEHQKLSKTLINHDSFEALSGPN